MQCPLSSHLNFWGYQSGGASTPWKIKIVMACLRTILRDEPQTVSNSQLRSSSPTLNPYNQPTDTTFHDVKHIWFNYSFFFKSWISLIFKRQPFHISIQFSFNVILVVVHTTAVNKSKVGRLLTQDFQNAWSQENIETMLFVLYIHIKTFKVIYFHQWNRRIPKCVNLLRIGRQKISQN